MSVNYAVRASVVDIETDSPRKDDSFLVDTNVWLWMCYGRASLDLGLNVNYLTVYPAYLKKALSVQAKLHRSSLSLAELSHVIEKLEHEYYNRTKSKATSLKEFRHNCAQERADVVGEVTAAWQQVGSLASTIQLPLNDNTTDLAVARLKDQLVDGYDLFLLESLSGAGQTNVLSNDGDFCTVPGIVLFTANRLVVSAAKQQGKLLSR